MFEATMTESELEAVLEKAATLSMFFREIGPKYDVENTFAYPSIEAFKKGNRADLLASEEAQLAIDAHYLPQTGEAELEAAIREAIRETGAQSLRDQGKVMGLLSPRLRGRADMKAVAARVQALLKSA